MFSVSAGTEVDELCPSMYSFHSDIDEKNKLLHVLLQHGIETTVDRVAKKARIKDWIQNSVIAEEDENEVRIFSNIFALKKIINYFLLVML